MSFKVKLGGDTTGDPTANTNVKVNGVSYPATPSTNTVPVVTGSNTVTYQTIADANVSSSAAIAVSKLAAGGAAQILMNNSTPTPTWTTVGGDATIGNTGSVTNTGLQGIAVPSPSGSNTTLTYNSGAYTWASGGSGITALTGDVTASGTGSVAATVAAISGSTPIVITPNEFQWVNTATPLIDQTALASGSSSSATTTGKAFSITAQAGQANTGSGNGGTGGAISITAGSGGTSSSAATGTGGAINITSGNANSTSGNGSTSSGAINIKTASPATAGGSGQITIQTGTITQSNGLNAGAILIQQANGATGSNNLGITINAGGGGVSLGVYSTYCALASQNQFQLTKSVQYLQTQKSTNYTVALGVYGICVNTHLSGAFTVTLPSTPSAGDTYLIYDGYGYCNVNNCTIAGNGNTINGVSSLVLNVPYASVLLTYSPAISGGGTGWRIVSSNLNPYQASAVKTVTASTFTIDSAGPNNVVLVNFAGACTITLPPPTFGRELTIKDSSGAAATNNITISQNASEKIDGANTYVLNLNYAGIDLASDGTNWFVVGSYNGTII